MRQGKAERISRHRRALVSCALAVLWLTILAVGALAMGGPPTAQAHGAISNPGPSATTPTGEPPTRTPRVTATATDEATGTVTPTRAQTQTNFAPGPQPTREVCLRWSARRRDGARGLI